MNWIHRHDDLVGRIYAAPDVTIKIRSIRIVARDDDQRIERQRRPFRNQRRFRGLSEFVTRIFDAHRAGQQRRRKEEHTEQREPRRKKTGESAHPERLA